MNALAKLAVSAALLALAFLGSAVALAQSGPGYGLAPAASHPHVTVSQPLTLFRTAYYGANSYRTTKTPSTSPPARGPYLTGPGQWVPTGQQADALALQREPGDTRATPAAASGHWNWKRASLADLVELSRRNKSSRDND